MDQDSAPVENLLGLLDLEPVDVDSGPDYPGPNHRGGPDHPGGGAFRAFRGRPPKDGTIPLFGGLLVGQGLAAAGRSVPEGYEVHSLHAHFLRPGHPDVPTDYRVGPLADVSTFASFRVSASQRGRELFTLTASFHRPEWGLARHEPMPRVPAPETLPTYEERLTQAFGQHVEPLGKPFDLRFLGPLGLDAARDATLRSSRTRVWLRVQSLPTDVPAGSAEREHLLHSCLLAYVSDTTVIDTVLTCHGLSALTDVARYSSLDHVVWFHRRFRADDWLLCELDTPVTAEGRSLVRGLFFTRDGHVAASMAQELLVRVTPEYKAARAAMA